LSIKPVDVRKLILGEEKRKTKRDSRRAFTKTQQEEILYQQDSKCAVCHKKLDPRAIHFHHNKPWASGGRTITRNGRAVCPKCHEILTHKERLKKVDKKRRKRKSRKESIPSVADIILK